MRFTLIIPVLVAGLAASLPALAAETPPSSSASRIINSRPPS